MKSIVVLGWVIAVVYGHLSAGLTTQYQAKILKQGDSTVTAKPGNIVSLHFTSSLISGGKLHSTIDSNRPFTF